MEIGNLELSEAAWLCLGKLAMAVELDCGKRFAFRKAAEEIVGLLTMAEASVDAEIRRRKEEFLQVVSPVMRSLLAGVLEEQGAEFSAGDAAAALAGAAEARRYRGAKVVDAAEEHTAVPADAPAGRRRYRGARVAGKPESESPGDAAVDDQGRKRIVYRGKVIYV